MAKRRKSVASRLDEAERTMYSTFSTAANSLSHLYTQAMNQQKNSFQEGERHALEKLHQWIWRKHEEGSGLTVDDIFSYLQNELDYGGEDTPPSPRLQIQHHSIPLAHFANVGNQISSVSFGQTTGVHGPRHGHSQDRTKNSVFSNAFPSPIRRNLQPYQLAQEGGSHQNNILPAGTETHNPEINCPNQNRDAHSIGSTDTSMEMHTE